MNTGWSALDDSPVPAILAGHRRLATIVRTLTVEQATAATDLPAWTRAHLLVHLGDLSRAFARQADYARKCQVIEVYDGGRPGRNSSIEENHRRPLEWLHTHLLDGLEILEQSWSRLEAADWERPSAYRDLPLRATAVAWWREVELHSVDLGLGYRAEDWSPALSAQVIDFLLPRLPDDRPIELAPTDAPRRWHNAVAAGNEGAAPVTVSGALPAIAAWLSGRPSLRPPSTTGTTAPLQLKDWP